MKIALIGYGKMGKAIEKLALHEGCKVVAKLEQTPTYQTLNGADLAIEFTMPSVAFENVKKLLELGIPTLCGTTGWDDRIPEIQQLCKQKNGTFLYSSNFSLGVNLFFKINKIVAQFMSKFDQYSVRLEEIHHVEKKDAPSGTAISLSKDLINAYNFSNWEFSDFPLGNSLAIQSKRENNVPGVHAIKYDSIYDTIELKHTAHSRDSFAMGVILAAKWIFGKSGIFTMQDVLNL